jgi:N-acetylneuraminate synthase
MESVCVVIAEIGINHNGSLEMARGLIDVAASAGCQAVKFQKRTVDLVYDAGDLSRVRSSVYGTTNGDLKRGLELSRAAYEELFRHSAERNLIPFMSVWDPVSLDFAGSFGCKWIKIPSALLSDLSLLRDCAALGRPVILSTGMSNEQEIEQAVRCLERCDLTLMVCTSCYPCAPEHLHLRRIERLRYLFGRPVGYSGHELGFTPTLAAVALGATMVERHVTLDRALWGSDQAASLTPDELRGMVAAIQDITLALGSGDLQALSCEQESLKKLRKKRIQDPGLVAQ